MHLIHSFSQEVAFLAALLPEPLSLHLGERMPSQAVFTLRRELSTLQCK